MEPFLSAEWIYYRHAGQHGSMPRIIQGLKAAAKRRNGGTAKGAWLNGGQTRHDGRKDSYALFIGRCYNQGRAQIATGVMRNTQHVIQICIALFAFDFSMLVSVTLEGVGVGVGVGLRRRAARWHPLPGDWKSQQRLRSLPSQAKSSRRQPALICAL